MRSVEDNHEGIYCTYIIIFIEVYCLGEEKWWYMYELIKKKRKLYLERFVIIYSVRYFKIGDTKLCFMFICLQSSKIKNGVENF